MARVVAEWSGTQKLNYHLLFGKQQTSVAGGGPRIVGQLPPITPVIY